MSGYKYNPVNYNRIERLTPRGWEQVHPMDVRELDILRMFDPNQRPSDPVEDIAGGNTWVAVGKPFIRIINEPNYRYEGWSCPTMRANLLREIYWRLGLIIGRYTGEMPE